MKSLFCCFAAGSLLFQALAAHAEVVTGLAVVVNNSVVTIGEIDTTVAQAYPTLAKMYPNDRPRLQQELKKVNDEVIETMVENKLILHDFSKAGFDTNKLEDFINDRIHEQIQHDYYGDRARLIRTLHEEGVTYDSWRRLQRENWIIKIMKNQNASDPNKILISPLKIQQYYNTHPDEFKMEDQVKLRMIVLTNSPDGPPGAAMRLGTEILAQLDSGVPFAELAAIYSAGTQRAEGGDRGWITKNLYKESLSKAAFSLKPGQHSGVIVEPEACYLLMVDDLKPAHVKTLVEVREDITKSLRSKENMRLYELWIDRLKRKTFVNYY